jgi:hypothetical protein
VGSRGAGGRGEEAADSYAAEQLRSIVHDYSKVVRPIFEGRGLRLCVISLVLTVCASAFGRTFELREGTVFRFATPDEGIRALRVEDHYVRRMSRFDRSAQAQKEGDVSTAEYLEHLGTQVLSWDEQEKERIIEVLSAVKKKTSWVKSPLPMEIAIIKTSRLDQGGNPYTRGTSIILPEGFVGNPDSPLEHVLLHELFHVLSRHNPKLQPRLYAIVGYEVCNELTMPAKWDARRLTNPDAPILNVRIALEYNGRKVDVAPVLFSKFDFKITEPRPFPMGYLDFQFVELQSESGAWTVRLSEGDPVLRSPTELSGLFEKIGFNTPYIIHPEEILADNFALAVGGGKIVTPKIVEELKALLSRPPQ